MAGISATLSREDLKFMAEDIGPELVPFLKPEDVLNGMDPEKQRELIALLNPKAILADLSAEDQQQLVKLGLEKLLKGLGLEKILSEMSTDSRKQLLELLVKMQASNPTANKVKNGNSTLEK